MKSNASKFVQIIATERSINALDESGDVWVYGGAKRGWVKLNMDRERDQDTSFRNDVKKANSQAPSWVIDDDIPF